MAYAVVASLRRTIRDLANDGHIGLNSSEKFLVLVFGELESLKKVLKKYDMSSSIGESKSSCRGINRRRVNAVDGQIREALSEFEDILEFHVSHQIHSQIQARDDDDDMTTHPLPLFTLDFDQLNQQFDSFHQTLINLKAGYIRELLLCQEEEEEEEEEEEDYYYYYYDDDDDDDDDDFFEDVVEEEDYDDDDDGDDDLQEEEEVTTSLITVDHHFGGDDDDDEDMVGLYDTFIQLKNRIITLDDEELGGGWNFTLISGMAGIGKTALAKKLFRDPEIATLFERRAFVSIGQSYRLEDVLLDILRQVNPEKSLMELDMKQKSIADLERMVNRHLKKRKCFIVLDDLWNKLLLINELKYMLPHNVDDDCHVLLTSRLLIIVPQSTLQTDTYCIPFLNKKESWHLLRKKVFGDQESSCPPQLVKAGEKIAEHCDGLPLTILKVANILSRADRTPEFWNEVAGQKQHPVFFDAYEQMFEVLYLSYDYLPHHLKPFFLYIGVFPQNYVISYSELFNLWCGERLYGRSPFFVISYLERLFNRNLVISLDKNAFNKTKKLRLHSVFWYMCNKEARKNKFFYCLNICADTLAQDMERQRRLCIQNNVLFGIKDVHNSISSISTVRSLLCTGTYHPYPVPVCLGLGLLRLLHALTLRLYEFPMETLNRVNLNYLALTLDAELPSSISKLWNLTSLIVRRHVRIVKSPSYLPMEIWNMKELEHLQVMGSDLPNPSCNDDDYILPNLRILSDVSARSCTRDIFKRIPHLKELLVRIELAPDDDDDDESLCFFDDISHLRDLEKLKCIMATPKMVSGVVAPPAPMSIRSSILAKLTLSGMGYPWEEMSKISSSLPNLMILKLRCYAFRGPEWVVADKGFPTLQSLSIEDTDLVKWTNLQDYYSLEKLEWLSIKHCYSLQEIHPTLFGKSLETIELVDCNPLAQSCAEKLKEHMYEQYHWKIELNITNNCGNLV